MHLSIQTASEKFDVCSLRAESGTTVVAYCRAFVVKISFIVLFHVDFFSHCSIHLFVGNTHFFLLLFASTISSESKVDQYIDSSSLLAQATASSASATASRATPVTTAASPRVSPPTAQTARCVITGRGSAKCPGQRGRATPRPSPR
jgi:hypothetical protein